MSTWQEQLAATQSTIAKCNMSYAQRYQAAEVGFWAPIAKWLWEERPHTRRLLDVGCGYGTLSSYCASFLSCECYMLDRHPYPQPELLDSQFHFRQCDIEHEPWPIAGHFEIILFTEVLEHLNHPPQPVIHKLLQHLPPGGYLLLSTPNPEETYEIYPYDSYEDLPSLEEKHQWQDGHQHLYTRKELETLLLQEGVHPCLWVEHGSSWNIILQRGTR